MAIRQCDLGALEDLGRARTVEDRIQRLEQREGKADGDELEGEEPPELVRPREQRRPEDDGAEECVVARRLLEDLEELLGTGPRALTQRKTIWSSPCRPVPATRTPVPSTAA